MTHCGDKNVGREAAVLLGARSFNCLTVCQLSRVYELFTRPRQKLGEW